MNAYALTYLYMSIQRVAQGYVIWKTNWRVASVEVISAGLWHCIMVWTDRVAEKCFASTANKVDYASSLPRRRN